MTPDGSNRPAINPLFVFLAVCTVLGVHYAFTMVLFDVCVNDVRDAIREGEVSIEREDGTYALEPTICPGLWDEVKNARNRGTDILLATGFGGGMAIVTTNGRRKKKKDVQPPDDDVT